MEKYQLFQVESHHKINPTQPQVSKILLPYPADTDPQVSTLLFKMEMVKGWRGTLAPNRDFLNGINRGIKRKLKKK